MSAAVSRPSTTTTHTPRMIMLRVRSLRAWSCRIFSTMARRSTVFGFFLATVCSLSGQGGGGSLRKRDKHGGRVRGFVVGDLPAVCEREDGEAWVGPVGDDDRPVLVRRGPEPAAGQG